MCLGGMGWVGESNLDYEEEWIVGESLSEDVNIKLRLEGRVGQIKDSRKVLQGKEKVYAK